MNEVNDLFGVHTHVATELTEAFALARHAHLVRSSRHRGLMAGIDWEQPLLDKLQRLAGDKLAAAAEALSHAGEITQKLFVNATDDNAIKMVEDLIKLRAGPPWQGLQAQQFDGRVHARQGEGAGVRGCWGC